jgi:glycosyltransferase involved in cell wall biosynthesis
MFAALKVKVLGARIVGGQADRIEEGFRAEGCQMVDRFEECDLCFVNDGGHYQKAIDAKVAGQFHFNAKLILGVLDLCPHCQPPLDLVRLKEQLAHAHAVTTISETVQRDIRARLGLAAHVVYNPTRAVSYARPLPPDHKHPFVALFVGRVNDPFKRAALGAAALSILGFGWDDMVTVGREPPHFGGTYAGEVSDEQLSNLYNTADFVMFPSSINEGLGLPMVEAMACGAIPVVCNDLCTRQEFLPSSLFPEYDEVEPNAPSIARFLSRFMGEDGAARKAEFSARLRRHYEEQLAVKLSPKGVAQAILDVYQSL